MENFKKQTLFIFLINLLVSLHGLSQTYLTDATLLTVSNEKAFHETFKKDTTFILEQKATVAFMHLINTYRAEKNRAALHPSNGLYLTARNHLVYELFDLKGADHYQTKKTARFSGRNPMNRLKFVLEKKSVEIDFISENCMVDGDFPESIGNQLPPTVTTTDDLNEIAENAAITAFENWKASPGHNSNMLSKSCNYYGIAFLIRDDFILSTVVFSDKDY